MKEHILQRWDWDDSFQRQLHTERFQSKPFSRIDWKGEFAGVLAFQKEDDHFRFGEFYLKREVRRNGLGTRILNHCLEISDKAGLPVRLEFLKWSLVGRLYKRAGFSVIEQNEILYFMQRQPRGEIAG